MIPYGIVLWCYSVTSKDIPSRCVREENLSTSSLRMPFIFRFQNHTSFCHVLYLCLIFNILVQLIQVLALVGRILNDDPSSCFCCLNLQLDLFNFTEFDMSSRQLVCKWLPCDPSFQSALSHTFPNLSHPFQFNDFNFTFSHVSCVMFSMDSHGFPHWRRHSKWTEDMILTTIICIRSCMHKLKKMLTWTCNPAKHTAAYFKETFYEKNFRANMPAFYMPIVMR